MANERKELFYTDMSEIFGPKENMSPYMLKDKWRVLPIYTEEYVSQTLYSTCQHSNDLTFDPKLEGWYKVYLHMPSGSMELKLTSDPCFLIAGSSPKARRDGTYMAEFLWRCVDMTGESITITKRKTTEDKSCFMATCSMLSAIRFVPMSDEEVAAYKADTSRPETKRIYATDDMHNRLFYTEVENYEDWLPAVARFVDSDVEWASLEQIRNFVSDRLPVENIDEFNFPRVGDMLVQKNFKKFDYDKVLKMLVDYGHEKGLKMSISLRMGAWGMTFPYDQFYFDCDYMMKHPELRTVDRNGEEIFALSYAYPEVRDYMVNELVNMARSGADAVTLISHRGIPYVLYEKPVADRFFELYGEYPYELTLDEPRLHALHCEIMTEFIRAARKALDENFPERHVELHLRSMFSVLDTKYIALDAEQWAKEGLIDAIISYPQRHYEKLDGDIWQEGKEWRIDLDKYTEYCHKNAGNLTYHAGDFDFLPSYKNYKGELCGPATQKERIAEWNALEEKYGVKMYYEILPRTMVNEEFKRRALDLYDNGAERFGLWDTYGRASAIAMWSTAGRIGHKDELREFDAGEGDYYRLIRMYKIGDCDTSRYNPMWGG